jgi:hypothetical protein
LELSGRKSEALFFNKIMTEDLYRVPRSQDWEVLPADHGGAGGGRGGTKSSCGICCYFSPGRPWWRGERSCSQSLFTPGLRSRFVGESILERWNSMVFSYLSCRACVGRGGAGAMTFSSPSRPSLHRRVQPRIWHLRLCDLRPHGGASSTSVSEALHRFC